ncbi:MAG: hypothetical protein KC590_05060 [Nitrospira sp.]|nr:hypothetical protein [Nitrospira sp.]
MQAQTDAYDYASRLYPTDTDQMETPYILIGMDRTWLPESCADRRKWIVYGNHGLRKEVCYEINDAMGRKESATKIL